MHLFTSHGFHCVKSVRIGSYFGPYSVRMQFQCGKTRTRITPNFQAVFCVHTIIWPLKFRRKVLFAKSCKLFSQKTPSQKFDRVQHTLLIFTKQNLRLPPKTAHSQCYSSQIKKLCGRLLSSHYLQQSVSSKVSSEPTLLFKITNLRILRNISAHVQ